MFGGEAAWKKADKVALNFIQENKGALSKDFFTLLGREAGGIVRDFRWNYGGTQTGVVETPAIDPIDIIGPALVTGLGGLIKGIGAGLTREVELAIAKGTVSSLMTASTRRLAVEGIEDMLKGLVKGELGTVRDRLLSSATNPELRKLIDISYRIEARIGSGSTGDAIRYELTGGNLKGSSSHIQKGNNLLTGYAKLLRGNFGELSQLDRNIIFEQIADLTKGTGLKWGGISKK